MTHATTTLTLTGIKVKSRDEAKEQLKAAQAARMVVEKREEFYATRDYRNTSEQTYFWLSQTANGLYTWIEANSALMAFQHLIPELKIGSGFTIGATHGGLNLGNAIAAANEGYQTLINALRSGAEMASMKATYQRRDEEWTFQAESATLELAHSDNQILAAEIRLAIAEKDLENHDVQMEHAEIVDDYMRSKFTNEELYQWMAGRLSGTYFQTYELALKAAKQAELSMEHELGSTAPSGFIGAGHWDGLKKGLLSGEQLQLELRRLEVAYTENDVREFEVTKHISLTQLDPFALIRLRATGTCEFEVPEVLYDMDFAGHYFRRIRAVSISLPCVAGPYTSVSATLTQMESRYRASSSIEVGYAAATGDSRFVQSGWKENQAIATSHGQTDSGLFELSFRDERYLPFEGTGAAGKWRLELPEVARQFNYDTISDVVMHVRYTARHGGNELKSAATTSIADGLLRLAAAAGSTGAAVAIDLKRDMSSEWYRLRSSGTVQLTLSSDRLPYLAAALPGVSIAQVDFLARGLGESQSIILNVNGSSAEVSNTVFEVAPWRYGLSKEIVLGQPFSLELSAGSALEQLLLIVRYRFDLNA